MNGQERLLGTESTKPEVAGIILHGSIDRPAGALDPHAGLFLESGRDARWSSLIRLGPHEGAIWGTSLVLDAAFSGPANMSTGWGAGHPC